MKNYLSPLILLAILSFSCSMPPLHKAAKKGDIEKAETVLKSGFEINTPDKMFHETALHKAVYYEQLEMVNFLIEKGADVNASSYSGASPLHKAADKANLEIVKTLHIHNADINHRDNNNKTPIFEAVGNANYGKSEELVIVYLIENGADINSKSIYNDFPIHRAAMNGYVQAVETIINLGGEVDPKNKEGVTPLMWASGGGVSNDPNPIIVKMLISNGANVNAVDKDGKTALIHAAIEGFFTETSTEILAILLENGADINAADNKGNTSLHYASTSKRPDLAEFLIDNGINIYYKNLEGETPLDWAKEFDNKEVKAILKELTTRK